MAKKFRKLKRRFKKSQPFNRNSAPVIHRLPPMPHPIPVIGKPSYLVVKESFAITPPKVVGPAMNVCANMAGKWGRSPLVAGAYNAADKFVQFVWSLGCLLILHWACAQFGGYFVLNPLGRVLPLEAHEAEQVVIDANVDFTKAMTSCMKRGGRTPENKRQLRVCWEEFKSTGESFVLAVEQGSLRFVALFYPLLAWLATGEVPVLAEA